VPASTARHARQAAAGSALQLAVLWQHHEQQVGGKVGGAFSKLAIEQRLWHGAAHEAFAAPPSSPVRHPTLLVAALSTSYVAVHLLALDTDILRDDRCCDTWCHRARHLHLHLSRQRSHRSRHLSPFELRTAFKAHAKVQPAHAARNGVPLVERVRNVDVVVAQQQPCGNGLHCHHAPAVEVARHQRLVARQPLHQRRAQLLACANLAEAHAALVRQHQNVGRGARGRRSCARQQLGLNLGKVVAAEHRLDQAHALRLHVGTAAQPDVQQVGALADKARREHVQQVLELVGARHRGTQAPQNALHRWSLSNRM
jgi:hypothetical protein